VADETRNAHRNAKRNPNRNQETTALGLFSFAILERDVKWWFHDSDSDFVLRSVADETRNGHRNAERNPNRNHETTV